MTFLRALALALVLASVTATAALADSPFRGNSGNFSQATCPSANNPHCPPQGG